MQAPENLVNRPEFAPIIEYGKGVQSHLSVIQGRTVIPPKSRSAVLGKHEAYRVAESVQNEEEAPTVTYIFNRSPASRTSLKDLKKIALGELRWCEVLRGRVLVVRTLTQPCLVEGALCTVIEDESGAVHNLRVYNVDYSDSRNVLPYGVALAIKEPYCEAATEATSGVRVDHPSDLVYLSEGDEHYPSSWRATFPKDLPGSPSEKLKDEGNDLFKKGLYRAAVCKYVHLATLILIRFLLQIAIEGTPPLSDEIQALLSRFRSFSTAHNPSCYWGLTMPPLWMRRTYSKLLGTSQTKRPSSGLLGVYTNSLDTRRLKDISTSSRSLSHKTGTRNQS